MNELFKNNLLDDAQKISLKKCSYQMLYLLKTYFPEDNSIVFEITGSTLNVYKVIFRNDTFECNCHNTNKSIFCKHICFIICYVCKLYDIDIFLDLKLNPCHKLILILRLFSESYCTDERVYDKNLANKYNIILKVMKLSLR